MGRPVIATRIMTRESQADSPKNPNEEKLEMTSSVGLSGLKGTADSLCFLWDQQDQMGQLALGHLSDPGNTNVQ